MNIVIIGDGKVGFTLAEQLSQEDHNIVVIDNRMNALRNPLDNLDVSCIMGNGVSYKVQQEAGVAESDLVIAVTSTDEQNMLCCLIARKLGAKHTIARVRNPEYREQLFVLKDDLGLSMTVNPEFIAAQEIARILFFPSATRIETFAKGRVELLEFKVTKNNPLDNQPLHSLYSKYQVKILICAVQRGDEVIIPDGNFVLKAGDRVSVTSSPTEILSFFKKASILYREKVKNLMIIGGGHICYYLAKLTQAAGMNIKIIEQNEDRSKVLAEELPKSSIIWGDGSEQELLLEEGIDQMDAFIALTGMDEENILLSMFASSRNVPKVVAKVNRVSYLDLLGNAGIDCVISPKFLTANKILAYVRSMENTKGSNVETLHRIVGGKVEALEFHIRSKASFLSVPLKSLTLKKNLLIACIIRHGKVIIPGGDDTLELEDSVIVVTTNPYLHDLSDILR